MSDQTGGVVITLKTIYDEVVSTGKAVIRMEGTLKDQGKDITDLQTRVRVLERWWWSAGATGVAGGGVASWVLQLLQGTGHA